MLPHELTKLATAEVQDFIFAHAGDDENKMVLRQREILGVPTALIAQQIAARRKAESKLSLFYKTSGVVYPPSVNVEQSSSEATARFKAEIISKELGQKKLIAADLTAGFGVDSFFLSKICARVDSVEPNPALNSITQHNFSLLKLKNVQCHPLDAELFLDQNQSLYDFIYLDPSRRDSHSKKVFRLADCQPNVQTLLPKLFERTNLVLLKASPLLDLQQGQSELGNVKKVIVVSVGNECKELLFIIQKEFVGEPKIETYNLDSLGNTKQDFDFYLSDEKKSVSDFGTPQTYLYEPNASILKSGAFKLIGKKFGLQKLHPGTHLYTSSSLSKKFPGRVFKIDAIEFAAKDFPNRKANVLTRNFPMKPEELKKKLKLTDGGEKYVIAFSGKKKKYIVAATRLV